MYLEFFFILKGTFKGSESEMQALINQMKSVTNLNKIK